jgi:hypothetical protein
MKKWFKENSFDYKINNWQGVGLVMGVTIFAISTWQLFQILTPFLPWYDLGMVRSALPYLWIYCLAYGIIGMGIMYLACREIKKA